ncbi:MAG: hypothetical protein CME60_14230 [Halobacteriovoraceae bacterium]|nr:hypothetical protein [Halobacteriovoraceae bacterium]
MIRHYPKITLLTLLFSPTIFSEPGDILVSAEKFERKYEKSTSSILVLGEEEIESFQATSVADLLKRFGGLSVQTNGAYGKASSLNLRGTDNRHTLVLIDGVRVTDITSISGGTRLEFLDPSQIEKIEILKGNQGVLYGSEAVGGVISITTKKEGRGNLQLSYGSYDYKKVSAFNSFKEGDNELSITGSLQDVDGISAYNEERIEGSVENDGLKQTDALVHWKNTSIDKLTFDFQAQLTSSSYLYDDQNADNANLYGHYQTNRYTGGVEYKYSELINLNLNYSHYEVDRKLFGENSFGKFHYLYKGDYDRYTLVNRSFYGDSGEWITGIEYEKERTKALDSLLDQTRSKERFGAYMNNYNEFGSWIIEEGLRYENLQFFGDEWVYRVGIGYSIDSFTVKATRGTSFKAPTLYQSFAQFGGNRNLEMEKSDSQEISLLFKEKRLFSELTYFEINYDNYIDYDLARSIYNNSGDFESYGVEWNNKITFDHFSLGLYYNYLRSKNERTGEALPRRAKHNGGLNLSYKMNDQWQFFWDSQYRGKRTDSNNKKLPSFMLTNISVEYLTNKSSDILSLSIKNLFNKEYEEVWGYGTPDRNFLISYRVGF